MNSKAFEEFKWRSQEPESKRREAPGQGIRWAQQAFPKAISKSVISGRRWIPLVIPDLERDTDYFDAIRVNAHASWLLDSDSW